MIETAGDGRRRRRRRRRTRIPNKKLEPHTKMWGTILKSDLGKMKFYAKIA